MRSSTVLSVIAIAAVGAQAAPVEQVEARTINQLLDPLGFLADAIHTATTTVENWFLYPNCMWKGVQSNPGYAVYKGWDNNAANVSLRVVFLQLESNLVTLQIQGGQNPGTSLKACEVQCNNLAT